MMRAYCAERLPVRLVVPVAALLTLAARVDADAGPPAALAIDAALLTLLFVEFRLWDDLADRGRDAVRHPGRVLVRSASLFGFQVAVAALLTLTPVLLASVSGRRLPLALFAGLVALTALWYRVRGGPSAAGEHVVLLKYPAFVGIVASGRGVDRPALVVCSVIAVYCAACVFEALHDPASPSARHRPLVAAEALLLVAALVAGARA